MNVYLIRHGETLSNSEHRYVGITDVSLSESGKDKIKQKVNEKYYPEYSNQIIYTSSLKRTIETLELIYGNVEHIEDERFNESNFGDFENKTYEELKNNPDYQIWISGDNVSNICPNGESYVMMKTRVINAFNEAIEIGKESGRDIIFLIHGGPIVALLEYLNPDEKKTYYEWRIGCGDKILLTLS